MKFIITGDTHGEFSRFRQLQRDEDTAVLILGDVGLNIYMDDHDRMKKQKLCETYPFTFYCLRGNHEARPENCDHMQLVYDEEVKGEVYVEEGFPRIRYFKNWGIYEIEGNRTLAIGGAYSVDKPHRLMFGLPWFPDEQLSEEEMKQCSEEMEGQSFDLVISHTCPYFFMPRDLFMPGINQSKVDHSMELWLEELKHKITWFCWLYGHFHDDRIEKPHAEMFYFKMEPLKDIMERWRNYEICGRLPLGLNRGPKYYDGDDVWPLR